MTCTFCSKGPGCCHEPVAGRIRPRPALPPREADRLRRHGGRLGGHRRGAPAQGRHQGHAPRRRPRAPLRRSASATRPCTRPALMHTNIATVFDYGEDDGLAFLVMELVDGPPLSAILAERGPLEPGEVRSIVGQAALALGVAHEARVVHRDVKPANILVRPDGVVKLTDFGIARALDASGHTQDGEMLGHAQLHQPRAGLGEPRPGERPLRARRRRPRDAVGQAPVRPRHPDRDGPQPRQRAPARRCPTSAPRTCASSSPSASRRTPRSVRPTPPTSPCASAWATRRRWVWPSASRKAARRVRR